MPAERPSWSISEPQTLRIDEPIESLQVRIVGGSVNIVGTGEPGARVEIGEVEGPPLTVTRKGGSLVVAYEDVPWQGFLKWLDRKGWNRHAVVSVSVPAQARLSVGVVGANAFVSGVTGRTDVRGVSGDTTLVGIGGPVRAETVSGNVEAQGLTGTVGFNSVSGDLTVIDGRPAVRADSVSGSMILDLDTAGTGKETDIALGTVSGEVALRLSDPVDATVEVSTASGGVSSAFDELQVEGQWGAKKVKGRLGTGDGRLRASSVSGSIALLRRAEPLHDDEDLLLSKDV
ncbi:DUF4097 family beta strand repeat-containing protein [Streptomyces sp. WMMB 322]|uniref:DUF4097 family beta strand repeat-containing protein n=1 Tax=Streptomyces sp. WMMB 322 TaxID=1286821 RepID=UPI0006E2A0D6|nr:DUF4097 family beta strand repeat-containing protein [Streptomyces sp. WMMB 322]SCK31356.1 hypothetical protein H180DRAFT_02487 [Streptomyces sp. WMMB 322]